jgi:hypothetical protein
MKETPTNAAGYDAPRKPPDDRSLKEPAVTDLPIQRESAVLSREAGTSPLTVIDPASGGWLFRVEALPTSSILTGASDTSVATMKAAAALVDRFPELHRRVRDGRALQVTFSPETRKALADGTAELMKGGKAIAVDVATKRTREIGKVGEGIAFGALALEAAPVLAVAAIAAAAAHAEQRWMERKFAEIQAVVDRLEIRLRDADLGALEAADDLVTLLHPEISSGSIPEPFRLEVAFARRDVEKVYLSRRRFVGRFLHALEQAQKQQADKSSERPKSGWTGSMAEELKDQRSGVVEELALFVEAMVVRARIGAFTAALVAHGGDGPAALRLIDTIDSSLRDDYFKLYRKMRALGRHGPDRSWWKSLPGVSALPMIGGGAQDDASRQRVQALVEQMHTTLGTGISRQDEDVTVVIPAGLLSAPRRQGALG